MRLLHLWFLSLEGMRLVSLRLEGLGLVRGRVRR